MLCKHEREWISDVKKTGRSDKWDAPFFRGKKQGQDGGKPWHEKWHGHPLIFEQKANIMEGTEEVP